MTSENIKNSFIEIFNKKGLLFFDHIEDLNDYVILTYHGNNLEEINIYIGFDLRDDGAIIATLGFYEFKNFDDNLNNGLLACNQANCTVSSKCHIDKDNDAVMTAKLLFDAYTIKSGFSPEFVLIAASEMAMDVDDVYPIFADAANNN